ncbi:MAG: glutamate--tRNA ligase [Erysipelotrichaceae bacterium]|nr:glutamate--tRNA ligase [Erysipelotrichaceae bacterium]
MANKVRTRFAPSPTGYMHIGNLRTALYTYLVAKKDNGTFILRIEDTDQGRLVEGATDIIYETLKQCGLKHDEGPDVGGDYGSYVQSERMASGIYKKYAMQLVEMGKAHICFCKEEDIQALREKAGDSFYYDDPCKYLSKEEIETRMNAGEPYVIRQNVNKEGHTSFDDEVYGTITVDNSTLDEMILLKSDGFPTYNFANVIDDHIMAITHVVRGNEYLSSTPKYNLLYEAFGWEKPIYIHCPPVMKDEHNKLSKRNGDASFQDLVAKGYLPEAILNYIALLGWAPSEEREIYSLDELVQAFDVKRIGQTGAIFDIEKLKWMNGVYLRNMEEDKYLELLRPELEAHVDAKYDYRAICQTLKDRVVLLKDVEGMTDFYRGVLDYTEDLYNNKKAKCNPEVGLNCLNLALPALKGLTEWNNDTIFAALAKVAADNGLKNITVMYPVQVALTGKTVAAGGATMIAQILGKEEAIARIEAAIAKFN